MNQPRCHFGLSHFKITIAQSALRDSNIRRMEGDALCTRESNAILMNSTVTKSSSSPCSRHPAARGWRTFGFAKTESSCPGDMTSIPNIRPRTRRRVQVSKSGTRSCVVSTDSTACLAFPMRMTEMATRPRACLVSRFLVVAPTTFVPVCPRSFLSCLRFPRAVPLSSLDSPRASNADPFSCLLAQNASRLFSFTTAHNRLIGGIEQGLGANRQGVTVLHTCNV